MYEFKMDGLCLVILNYLCWYLIYTTHISAELHNQNYNTGISRPFFLALAEGSRGHFCPFFVSFFSFLVYPPSIFRGIVLIFCWVPSWVEKLSGQVKMLDGEVNKLSVQVRKSSCCVRMSKGWVEKLSGQVKKSSGCIKKSFGQVKSWVVQSKRQVGKSKSQIVEQKSWVVKLKTEWSIPKWPNCNCLIVCLWDFMIFAALLFWWC